MKWFDRVLRLPGPVVLFLALGMIGVVGVVDYLTGPQLGCSIFHLVPILLVSWVLGRAPGFFIAAVAAVVWLLVDLTDVQRYWHSWMPFWNAGVRLFFFAVFVALFTAMKHQMTLARQDPLTGLANRRGFFEVAEKEIERSRRYRRPLSLALVDCDHFKTVNDRLGHLAGDRLLASLAALLRSHCRANDTAARLGGDEFALLFPETDAAGARTVVRKLQEALPFSGNHCGVMVTLSAGVATYLFPPASIDEVLRTADECLYQAKAQGGGGLIPTVVAEIHEDDQIKRKVLIPG